MGRMQSGRRSTSDGQLEEGWFIVRERSYQNSEDQNII